MKISNLNFTDGVPHCRFCMEIFVPTSEWSLFDFEHSKLFNMLGNDEYTEDCFESVHTLCLSNWFDSNGKSTLVKDWVK